MSKLALSVSLSLTVSDCRIGRYGQNVRPINQESRLEVTPDSPTLLINRVNACDRPERYERIRQEFEGSGINIVENGHLVSRRSDFIIYSVEAEYVDAVVKAYGPCICSSGRSLGNGSDEGGRGGRRTDVL